MFESHARRFWIARSHVYLNFWRVVFVHLEATLQVTLQLQTTAGRQCKRVLLGSCVAYACQKLGTARLLTKRQEPNHAMLHH